MMQLNCPWCGPRNVSEFHHRGEIVPRPQVATTTPQDWRQYLYERANTAGWSTETWYHSAGCRRFLTIERDTLTNQIRPVDNGSPEVAPVLGVAEQTGAS